MALRAVLRRCVSADRLGINKCGSVRTLASDGKSLKSSEPGKDTKPVEERPIPVLKSTQEFLLSKEEVEARRRARGTITVAEVEDVGLTSGVPEEHIRTRTVRIYQPAKNAMQSGTSNTHFWQIEFDTRERWENPLIGWTSTGDPMSNVKVDFASKEEAIEHCKKMGWRYYVQKPNVNNPKPRTYGMNFAWNKRTRVSTK